MPAATVVPVKQRTPEWVAARLELGIGASEAAAALGMSQWQSPISLWAQKLGLVPPQPETLPMRIGSELEPLIARMYTEQTGTKIRRVNMLRQHPVHEFMLASIDRRAGKRLVELKYTHRGTGYGEPGTDELPDEVLVQVLHQLAVMDVDEADVAVIRGGRQDLDIYTVVREPEAEAAIIDREAVFWDHVQSRTEPPLDGSEATLRALSAIYPRDEGETVEAAAADQVGRALRSLGQLTKAIAEDEDQKAAERAEIEAFMGTASKLVVPGVGSVTWKTPKESTVIDWKAIASTYARTVDTLVAELRGRISEVTLEGVDVSTDEGLASLHEAVESLFTTTKANTRRFTPTFEEE